MDRVERAKQWRSAWSFVACGLLFLAMSNIEPKAFSPEIYGYWAYQTPAEIWSAGFMVAGMFWVYGLHINGRAPLFSPVLRIIGVGMLLALFLMLIWSALTAPYGTIVVVFGGLFFVPELVRDLHVNLRLWLFRWGLRNVGV